MEASEALLDIAMCSYDIRMNFGQEYLCKMLFPQHIPKDNAQHIVWHQDFGKCVTPAMVSQPLGSDKGAAIAESAMLICLARHSTNRTLSCFAVHARSLSVRSS